MVLKVTGIGNLISSFFKDFLLIIFYAFFNQLFFLFDNSHPPHMLSHA